VQITIDNFDGLGPVDYSSSITPEGPVMVQRALNVPSRCTAEIVVGLNGFALPVRRAKVTVLTEVGEVLFTGYLATVPVRIYAGDATTGAVYRARLSAVSEEWLLDNQGSGGSAYDSTSLTLSGQALIARMASRVQANGVGSLSVAAGTGLATGAFTPVSAAPWSENAGSAAGSAYSNYRVLSGEIVVQQAASVTHPFSDADGTLSVAELQTRAIRDLANDITLSGAEEPAAYIQENFIGDGTTTVFELSEPVFRGAHRTLLADSFNEAAFDLTQWKVSDPGNHLALSSAGLTMNGGNGSDGQTTLSALDVVEMGGSIIVELGGVVFGAASDGMLSGLYEGTPVLANCFAGYRVRQNSGVTVLVPIVNGLEVGTVFTPMAGQQYTLRLRLHCAEMQRVMQRYYSMVDGMVQGFGSASGVSAPMDVVFELVDESSSSNTPATVLYDSISGGAPLNDSPATCEFVVANATQLFGSIASVSVTRPSTAWIVSTLPDGVKQTRLIGLAGQGVDCTATYGTQAGTTGKITFFNGRVPAVGERVTVSYRTGQRAVARLADAASIATEAIGGAPGTSRWLGKVLQPVARSSADVESAAQAVLAVSTSRTAAVSGSYTVTNPLQDIWPGDVLAITSEGVTLSFLVRSVVAKDGGALPEVMQYELKFANDWAAEWADGIGVKLNEEIATDVLLPREASSGAAQVLANLSQVSVMNVTETALYLDAGTDPPVGGGFEVRLKDGDFGFGFDAADLVLRSPVRAFSIPRATQLERFYVRMYDASTPPLYSRFSSAVFVDAPVS
jgi:hypothetical protein